MRAAALLLTLLLLPLAQAAPDESLARSVATDGDYLVEGRLAGLRHYGIGPDDGDPRLGLRIDAASLLVEHETQGSIRGPGNSWEARAERSTTTYEDATVLELETRPGRDVTVLPIDARVEATGHGATLAPSEKPVLDAEDNVDNPDRTSEVPVGHAVQVHGLPSVVVTGHFVVMLTEMDVTIDGETYHSGWDDRIGTAPYDVYGVTDVTGPSTANATELVLEVRDGVLRLGPGAGDPRLHVDRPTVHLASARLEGVTGTPPGVLGGGRMEGATLSLGGELRIVLDAAGGALAWSLDGRVATARLDGRPVAVVAPLPGGGALRPWLPWSTALMLLAPVLASVGALPLHRRLARRRLEDAELLLAAGHFQAAAEVARPLPLTGVRGPTAALRTQALLHAGDADAAHRAARVATRRSDRILAGLVQATVEDWEDGDGGAP